MRAISGPRCVRLVGLALVVGLAVVLASAVSASAQPEFNPPSGTFTVSGGAGTLKAATAEAVSCSHSEAAGSIASPSLAGPFLLTFTGCKVKKGTESSECAINSVGKEPGSEVILTGTVHAVLVLALVSGESRWPGLWVLPVGTTKFTELEKTASPCETPESKVSGSVVGLISPIGVSRTTAEFVFDPQTTATLEECSGESVHIKLEAYGVTATEQTTAEVKFSQSIEIT